MFIINMAILLNKVYADVLSVTCPRALNAPFTKSFDEEAGLTNHQVSLCKTGRANRKRAHHRKVTGAKTRHLTQKRNWGTKLRVDIRQIGIILQFLIITKSTLVKNKQKVTGISVTGPL